MAPSEIAKDFQSFLAKVQSTSSGPDSPSSTPKTQSVDDSKQGTVDRTTEKGTGTATSSGAEKEDVWKGKPAPPVDYENFWEAPEYIWKQKEWTEAEIEAVMVGSPFFPFIHLPTSSRGSLSRGRMAGHKADFGNRAEVRHISDLDHNRPLSSRWSHGIESQGRGRYDWSRVMGM